MLGVSNALWMGLVMVGGGRVGGLKGFMGFVGLVVVRDTRGVVEGGGSRG